MKWQKKGFICSHETFDIPWYKKNTIVPLPYLISDGRLRIYVTMCDELNIGRIGYIDVDPANPSRILGYSKQPVLDVGTCGFFCKGIITASLLKVEADLFLYYSGYQSASDAPYRILSGVAVSRDNGHTFSNLSTKKPILGVITGEVYIRSSPYVIQEEDIFRVWYTADTLGEGPQETQKKCPPYNIRHLTVDSPYDWSLFSCKTGTVAIPIVNESEHGIGKGTIWKENGLYKIIYSIRTLGRGYRLGYAESSDGYQFTRMDSQVGIDVSEGGWDSDMIVFPEIFKYLNKTYLFYSGNHYGMGGMGYAELSKS
ncbi:MAG: hypothetical protein CK424_02960 [Legionella sp.]|nr:MAG: hypothetical protein CK424_02960 [Legionella sp.]